MMIKRIYIQFVLWPGTRNANKVQKLERFFFTDSKVRTRC